jgi:large subunit ribosomal protein L29
MALLKTKDIKAMRPDEVETKLKELDDELMHERGVAAMGGAPASPGKIRALRTNVARILTVQRELEIAEEKKQATKAPAKKKAPKKRPAKKTAGSRRGGGQSAKKEEKK